MTNSKPVIKGRLRISTAVSTKVRVSTTSGSPTPYRAANAVRLSTMPSANPNSTARRPVTSRNVPARDSSTSGPLSQRSGLGEASSSAWDMNVDWRVSRSTT